MGWRLFCGALLVCLGGACISQVGRAPSPSLPYEGLGAIAGLFLGVVHVPEDSAGRYFSSFSFGCRVAFCSAVAFLSAYAAAYPWLLIPKLGPLEHHRVMVLRWQQVLALAAMSSIWVFCILKKHPRSAYAHDAKWCMFGYWLVTLAFQVADVCWAFGLSSGLPSWTACGYAIESVVIGWIGYIFQIRMTGIRSRSTGSYRPTMCMLLLGGAFFINAFSDALLRAKVLPLELVLIPNVLFVAMWSVYTALVCMSLVRKRSLALQEVRRVRGFARQQARWAARILGLELLTCAVVGVTTCSKWLPVVVLHSMQLLSRPHKLDMSNQLYLAVFYYFPSIASRCDRVINSLGLAILSGILWQEAPPQGDDEEFRRSASARGLASMAKLLNSREQEVYPISPLGIICCFLFVFKPKRILNILFLLRF